MFGLEVSGFATPARVSSGFGMGFGWVLGGFGWVSVGFAWVLRGFEWARDGFWVGFGWVWVFGFRGVSWREGGAISKWDGQSPLMCKTHAKSMARSDKGTCWL